MVLPRLPTPLLFYPTGSLPGPVAILSRLVVAPASTAPRSHRAVGPWPRRRTTRQAMELSFAGHTVTYPNICWKKSFPTAGALPSPTRPESRRHQSPAGRRCRNPSRYPRARLRVAGSVSSDHLRSAKPPRVASGPRYTRGGVGPTLWAVHGGTNSPAGQSSGSSPAGGGAPSTSATAAAPSSP